MDIRPLSELAEHVRGEDFIVWSDFCTELPDAACVPGIAGTPQSIAETSGAHPAISTVGLPLRADPDLLQSIARNRLKILLTEDLRPVLKIESGPYKHPVAVCSIPKAGTYLVGRLLALAGYVDPEIHASVPSFSDYRWVPTEVKRREPGSLQVMMPLEKLVQLIRPGQFLVGHLPCNASVRTALTSFHKLFVKRELRATIVSFTRWTASTGRGGEQTKQWQNLPEGPDKTLAWLCQGGMEHIRVCRSLAGWIDEPDVHCVSFEELCGDFGRDRAIRQIERICAFVDAHQDSDRYNDMLGSLLATDTLTWSGQRSQVDPFWDDRVETYFAAMGGPEVNRLLGYDS